MRLDHNRVRTALTLLCAVLIVVSVATVLIVEEGKVPDGEE